MITDFLVLFICLNSPEGVETLCSGMGVQHTDVRILMLAWYVVFRVHVILSILHSDLYLTFIINLSCFHLTGKWKLKSRVIFLR